MKILLTAVLSVLFLQESYGQDSIRVIRQYNNDKPSTSVDSFFHKMPNTVFVSLDEGFDDSLHIRVNDTVVLNQYMKSNESIGHAGGFGIHFNDSTDVKILKLKFVKGNFYIEEKVSLKYKSLQIRGLNPWLLIYTNHFPMRE